MSKMLSGINSQRLSDNLLNWTLKWLKNYFEQKMINYKKIYNHIKKI